MIEETIVLKTNAQGYPILERSGDLKVEILIQEDSTTRNTDVEILGDGAALRRLGEVLVGVSQAKGYHVHLESTSDTSPLDIRPRNIRLTISNSDTPKKIKSSSPAPDWAK